MIVRLPSSWNSDITATMNGVAYQNPLHFEDRISYDSYVCRWCLVRNETRQCPNSAWYTVVGRTPWWTRNKPLLFSYAKLNDCYCDLCLERIQGAHSWMSGTAGSAYIRLLGHETHDPWINSQYADSPDRLYRLSGYTQTPSKVFCRVEAPEHFLY